MRMMKVNAEPWNELKTCASGSKKYPSPERGCLSTPVPWNGESAPGPEKMARFAHSGGVSEYSSSKHGG